VQEEDVLTKRKRKEQFDGELLMLWKKYKNSQVNNNQLTFGLAGRLQTCLPFVSVEEDRGKKRKKINHVSVTFFQLSW